MMKNEKKILENILRVRDLHHKYHHDDKKAFVNNVLDGAPDHKIRDLLTPRAIYEPQQQYDHVP